MITLLHEQRETRWADACAEGDALWLDAAAIEEATGWTWKPEGLCRGDACVPLPRAGKDEGEDTFVRDGRLDLAAIWRLSGQPVVRDAASRTWVLGTGSVQRAAAIATLLAPDFALPDLAGKDAWCLRGHGSRKQRSRNRPGRI